MLRKNKMKKEYHVKVASAGFNFPTLEAAMAFAQKESWDKAHPTVVFKPDGKSIEVSISAK